MSDLVRIRVLRAYRKGAVVVAANEVLDEDKSLAVNLLTANKAERVAADTPTSADAAKKADKGKKD